MTCQDRRGFLGTTVLGLGAWASAGGRGFAEIERTAPPTGAFPRQDPAVVEEMVRVAHVDVNRVKQLVESRPALARAAVDWGFGDWEDALGAASHMGRRDIADVLIRHGARPTIFSAAMMGQLDVVTAFISAQPGCQRIPGPHGLTLLWHARVGGEQARRTLAYLETLGDADLSPTTRPLDPTLVGSYTGSYVFGGETSERLDVAADTNGRLSITRPGLPFPRPLTHLGNHEFLPMGADAVRIRFTIEEARASALVVIDGDVSVTAVRR
jgi:hypothetical protein